jgi:hypothetical protein
MESGANRFFESAYSASETNIPRPIFLASKSATSAGRGIASSLSAKQVEHFMIAINSESQRRSRRGNHLQEYAAVEEL